MNKEQADVNIKQRLIGAVVLVSLGVIIIPLLLNGGSDSQEEIYGSNVPPVPVSLNRQLPEITPVQTTPAPEPIVAVPVEHSQASKTTVRQVTKENVKQVTRKIGINQDVKSVRTVKAEKFNRAEAPKNRTINQAYTLQIASFSSKKNAFALRDKLRKKKFKAYIESVLTDKGKIYRLRVGPYLKYQQLTAIQKQIEKQFKLKQTIIVNYKT